MAASINELGRVLTDQLTGGVVVVLSSDSLLLRQGEQAVRQRVAVPDDDEFNADVFDATTSLAAALDAARSYPMMAESRWVLVRNCHLIKEKNAALLLTYLADPAPQTVLCVSGEKLDKRSKLYKTLAKVGTVIELGPPSQRELPGWIVRRAAEHGLTMPRDAADLLADVVGANLEMLERSLEQVASYCWPETRVTSEAVEELICRSRTSSVFDLTDAIGARHTARALDLLRRMEADGEAALMVLSMIARQYRLLVRAKVALSRGAPEGSLASTLKLPPFVVRGLVGQARQYQVEDLIAAFPLMRDADLVLKRSAVRPFTVLQELVFKLGEARR